MTVDEKPIAQDPIETVLKAFEKGDAVAAASAYAEDGVYIDPRYPEFEYHGREAIREAFEWALTTILDPPEYEVRHYLESHEACAIEVENHGETDRPASTYPQVFFVEVGQAGITRWQTYLPNPRVIE